MQRLTNETARIRLDQLRIGTVALLAVLAWLGPLMRCAQAAPNLVSIFPLGGQRGTTLDVEFQGAGFDGAYAVWLGPGSQFEPAKSSSDSTPKSKRTKGPDGLQAHVVAVPDGSRAKVTFVVSAEARLGFHAVAIVSPTGLSATVPFWVGPHAVIQEAATPHHSPQTAQQVKLPVAVSGRGQSGQLAYYSFDILEEQTAAFEVLSLRGADFDPQLALYEAGGSFLDPQRPKRLVFHEEVAQGGMPAVRRMTYRFAKPGRYVVSLGNPFAQGGGGSSYLFRIAPNEGAASAEDALSWGRGRVRELASRSVAAPVVGVGLVKEAESDEQPQKPQTFQMPAVLEGTIGRPGNVDAFKFRAKAGQKLAMEIRTPRAAPPHFNLRLDVLDAKGATVLSNLRVHEAKVGTVDAKVMQFVPVLSGTLAEGGEYSLRVRNLTSTHGSGDHLYSVLIRPQIPHVGDIELQPAGPVNLRPGAKHRIALTVPAKEGHAGGAAISVEGVPPGVRAFVGANNSLIELVADSSAPLTAMPQVLRVSGLAVEGGKSGAAFTVAEIPIMVVNQ